MRYSERRFIPSLSFYVLLTKMKRRTWRIVGVAAVVLGAGSLLIIRGHIVETLRMHRVACRLESSVALREAYGPGCSVTALEYGLQSAIVLNGFAHHCTQFRVRGNGTDKTLWVKWSNRIKGCDVTVHEFTEQPTPYTGVTGTLRVN